MRKPQAAGQMDRVFRCQRHTGGCHRAEEGAGKGAQLGALSMRFEVGRFFTPATLDDCMELRKEAAGLPKCGLPPYAAIWACHFYAVDIP